MDCDKYLEWLSARLDGALSGDEERELEEHLAVCPDCRAAGAQLSALQVAFDDLEEIRAPEGFARGVMDRIRAEGKPKVLPLFQRPQVRALAGLAACLALIVGLYGVGRHDEQDDWDVVVRSFRKDALTEEIGGTASGEDVPQIAAYAAPEDLPSGGTEDSLEGSERKHVPDMAYAEIVLTLDRMPEGGWELIPPDTFVSPAGLTVSVELMEQIEQLAVKQGIGVSRASGPEVNDRCLIVILDETG